MRVITGYTKEAGLRNMEREIGTICRKIAVQVAEGKTEQQYRITDGNIDKFLGPMKHFAEELLERDQVEWRRDWPGPRSAATFSSSRSRPFAQGQALPHRTARRSDEGVGAGGADVCTCARGRERDSARLLRDARHSHPRARGRDSEGRTVRRHHDHDGDHLRPHGTSGAPQRGHDGEVTLRGDVLPIGGVKEKVLAARAAKLNTVILPKLNERDLVDVPEPIKRDMTFHFVEHVEDVLQIALLSRDAAEQKTTERSGRESRPLPEPEPAPTHEHVPV